MDKTEIILEKIFKPFVVFALCALLFMSFRNESQRAAAVKDIKDAGILNRSMLNSRAQIQIILCNAALEGRALKATEIDTIKRLWRDAEYDRGL